VRLFNGSHLMSGNQGLFVVHQGIEYNLKRLAKQRVAAHQLLAQGLAQ